MRALSALAAFLLIAAFAVGPTPSAAVDSTGPTTRISVADDESQAHGDSERPAVSADGTIVVFDSAAGDLIDGDHNAARDVFVRNTRFGTTERASVSWRGFEAQGSAQDLSASPDVSADGNIVVFHSFAHNLVASDTNGAADIFVRDRRAGTIERVSIAGDGSEANGHSQFASVDAGGDRVAFQSDASNLVANDTNVATDIFVHDRSRDITVRVSESSSGAQAAGSSSEAEISPDGRVVAFTSSAVNLVPGDTNGAPDVFVHEVQTGRTDRVSVSSSGGQAAGTSGGASLSTDGRFVAFWSQAENLVPGDTNNVADIFVHDRHERTTTRVSLARDGTQANGSSRDPAISPNGLFVSFESDANNLSSTDNARATDVFVRDRSARATFRVSIPSPDGSSVGQSYHAVVTDDARAAFASRAALVAADTNNTADVYVHDVTGRGGAAGAQARPAVVRGSTWYLRGTLTSGPAQRSFVYGHPDDVKLVGDWDGDGISTPGVKRGSSYYLRNSNSTGPADIAFIYGNPEDLAVAGDWNGDGIDTIGVFRAGRWLLRNSNSSGPADMVFRFGNPRGFPLVGDWNGNGTDTVAVVLGSKWMFRQTNTTGSTHSEAVFGHPGDVPLSGDWDGDGTDTMGAVRGSTWLVRNAITSGPADHRFWYGKPHDWPLARHG